VGSEARILPDTYLVFVIAMSADLQHIQWIHFIEKLSKGPSRKIF
jgi:hypothetical protein